MSLNLVLSYESSALAAPQSFRDGMQAAANILDSLIQDNITVTIQVGYGDWYNNTDTGLTTGAEGGDLTGSYVSYSTLRAALANHVTSSLDQTLVNSLPATTSLNGVSSYWVSSAVEKALGLMAPNAATIDGAVGIGTQISGSLLVGVALHELTHAMGRVPDNFTFDLVRYTSAGNHLFSMAATAPAAYFSVDGGYTKLADFGQTSDPSDFLNSGVQGSTDPFNEFYSWSTNQSLSSVDKQIMDALGFNVTPVQVTTVIESVGSTSLSQVGSNYTMTTGSISVTLKYAGAPVTAGQFGAAWTPVGAEANGSGYIVAWKAAGADQYTEWVTDSSGAYVSDPIGIVSGSSSAISSLETLLNQDLNGDGRVGLATTVIESAGSTSLTQIGSNYYLYNGGAGPALKFGGAVVTAGQFGGGWAPVGAEASGGGYVVAWKAAGADQYTEWLTDSSGNYVSDPIGIVSGSSSAVGSLETLLHQDLNGDGTIGQPSIIIESAGSTSLTQIGSNYYLYSGGTGPALQYGGAAVTAGQFGGGWAPIGAESSGSGYVVAWKAAGSDQYTEWMTDSSGNYLSDPIGIVAGSNSAIGSLETLLHQDLNGDGAIGLPSIVIEAAGSTSLTQIGSNYYLYIAGAGPALKYGGALITAGQFGGGWAPIGAEANATGYTVVWKAAGTDVYTEWLTDTNGNFVSDPIGWVSGSSAAIKSLEITLQQDLNGNGTVGATAPLPSATASLSAFDGSHLSLAFGASSTINVSLIGFSGDGTLGGSNQVDLRGLDVTKLHSTFDASTGVLSVSDGTSAANLQFLGCVSQESFKFVTDGAGGTTIYVAPAANGTGSTAANSVAFLAGEAFVFAPNFGQATLSHFDPANDTVQINHNVFADMNAFLAAARDDGNGNVAVADALHDTLSIQHVTLAQIQAHQNDFHFV